MEESLKILKPYLRGLPIIILCMVAGIWIAKKYLSYTTPMYESTTKLRLADVGENVTGANLFKDLDEFASANKIAAEIEVIKSHVLLEKVLDKLGYHTTLYRKGAIKNTELYKDSPINLQMSIEDDQWYGKDFIISVKDTENYTLTLPNVGTTLAGKMDESLQFEGGKLLVGINRPLLEEKRNMTIIGTYVYQVKNKEALIQEVLTHLDVTSVDKDVPVIRISYKSAVPEKAAVFVNALASAYIDDYISIKYQAAETTSQFLDNRIDEVSKKLSNSENNIQGYRDDKNIINIRQETETDLRKISQLKIQQTNIKMNLEAIHELNDYIARGKDNFLDLAPNFEAFTDLLSTEMVKKTKQLQGEKKDLLLTYTANDERVRLVDKKIKDHTDYLVESIQNTKKSLDTKYKNLNDDIEEAEKVFIGLPEKEKLMNMMNRDFEIFQGSYNFLNNKKIEADIARAAKLSFHRIITPAAISKNPVSPNRPIIIIVCALLGMFFAIALITIVHALKARVNDVESIESNSTLPVSLHTPYLKSPEALRKHFLKSVQNLFVKEVIQDKEIVCFTSAKTNEGKILHLVNVAEVLGLQGRKVLILDAEGILSNIEDISESPLKTKLSNVDYLRLDIEKFTHKTLDALETYTIQHLDQYDLVLINNESITDGILSNAWMSLSDCNLVFLDARYTPKKAILQYNLLCDEFKFSNVHFVLNRYQYNPNIISEMIQIVKKFMTKPVKKSLI
jgi:uncharacterized protein involved in exopolysaccharide biosynthesis